MGVVTCLPQGRDPSTIDEVSAADECGQEMQILPNFFDNRRKSCYSWRLRHQHRDKVDIAGREAGAGAGSGSFSCESQVFEIIHLDENNEQVSSRDKMITGASFDTLSHSHTFSHVLFLPKM